MPFISVLRPRDAALARRAADAGQGVLAAEPLARMRFAPPWARWLTSFRGLWYLARALSRQPPDESRRLGRCLRKVLKAPDLSRVQLAMMWVLSRPGVAGAVVGTTRPEHVRELADACRRTFPGELARAIEACHAAGPGAGDR